MNRNALLALAAVLAAGCADNRTSISIRSRAAPSDATTCTFAGDGDALLGPGTLDVSAVYAATRDYSTVLYVENGMIDPTDTVPGTTPSANAWRATAARIRINPTDFTDDFPPGPALLNLRTIGRLPLDGQTVPPGGKAAQWVDVLSLVSGGQVAAAFGASTTPQRIVVGITLEGFTLGGQFLDTGEFFFPIDVCSGCLACVGCAPGTLTCPVATPVLANTNCFGLGQDSAPVCN